VNPRLQDILDHLSQHGEASVRELSELFGVSEMTVRRDLTALEREGHILRTHGGAVRSNEGIVEFAFRRRGRQYAAEKRAIATAAGDYVSPGMSLTLDTGTTTLEVAKRIATQTRLTVLTSSLAIAATLYAHEHIELILLGGRARRGNPDLSGWLTEENLKRFHVDLAVIGADGAGPAGVYTTDVDVSRVSQAVLSGARRTMLAADHSKFEQTAFVKFAEWDKIDVVVTDDQLPHETRGWLESAVGEVRYAPVRAPGDNGE
jgi:DeoR/GlpR family transcriptional regulator of sugar metabolism